MTTDNLKAKELKNGKIYNDYFVKVYYHAKKEYAAYFNDNGFIIGKKFNTFKDFLTEYKKFVSFTHKQKLQSLFNKNYKPLNFYM